MKALPFALAALAVVCKAWSPSVNQQPQRAVRHRTTAANKFGMGIYNDSGAPGLDEQLPEARALLGASGQVLLYFNLLFGVTGDASSCKNDCQPRAWELSAINQAYALGLQPVVRIGQWSRQIRNFSDDAQHRNYTSLGQAYQTFLAGLPRPPDGSDLPVILLNEPNVCGEWQCGDGPGVYLGSQTRSAEVASCLRDLLAAVRPLSRLRMSLAPLAYAAPERCECVQPGHNIAPNFSQPNDIGFIRSMRAEVPDLWATADFFSAHTYPFHGQPFSSPLGRAGIENYLAELQAVGRNASVDKFPVAIAEMGWHGPNEQMKATSMVSAYKEVYLRDPTVFAVMPYLFAVYNTSQYLQWSWMQWDLNGTRTRSPQARATYQLRCGLGIGGACSKPHATAPSWSADSIQALPPGPGPFGCVKMAQPVPGAARALTADGWKRGKLCDVSKPPFSAQSDTNATAILQRAIDTCGDLPGGGTVLIPAPMVLLTASLFLRSNLTFRVEAGAVLRSTATGSMRTPESIGDAPIVYARRNSLMTPAHAGLLNGGVCLEKKSPLVGWDDCERWSKLSNVAIEGGGLLDADGDDWYKVWGKGKDVDQNQRPMMLDLMWIDGLTVRDMQIRRPGYWTVHPTFSNNVRITNNSIVTYGSNTDGCDPDSSWNVYIARNYFSTGDDCIAIKAGRDWSGRMVNISTQNVLAEENDFAKGHGVSIGSETSGWVRDVLIRNSVLHGTDLAVRIKTMRGRGGGVEDVTYEGLRGSVKSSIQLTLNYHSADPTNVSGTPALRNVTLRDLTLEATEGNLVCDGLSDSVISGIIFQNVTVTGKGLQHKEECSKCNIAADAATSPQPHCHQRGAAL